MNIIELVKYILQKFPKIREVCNQIQIDFTDNTDDSYGLYPTGDTLISEDVIGNQTRQHTFILYAVYQSQSDYDRIANSDTLLQLQMYLESQSGQAVTMNIDNREVTGTLTKLTCSNGMLYAIPEGDLNSGVMYQIQITAEYKIDY